MRVSQISIFALLFVAVAVASVTQPEPEPVTGNFDFDYLLLTLFVSSGQPLADKRCHLPPGVAPVTIHGLWPTDWETQGPNTCPGPAFSADAIADMKDDLLALWPTFMGNTNDHFHDHEWTKHGTCAALNKVGNGAITDEHSYFRWVMDYLKNLDPMALLAKDNIIPDWYKTYEYNDIINALHYNSGHLMTVTCLGPKAGPKYFTGITACLDHDLKQIDCPLSKVHKDAGGCKGGVVTFPPLE